MNRPYEIVSVICASRGIGDVNLGFIELSNAVNEMTKNGYAPVGGITTINNENFFVTLFQAVYKESTVSVVDKDKQQPKLVESYVETYVAKKRGRPAKK